MVIGPLVDYQVVVVGGGHAGCEAALASARLGCRTALLTMNLDTVGHMPCNCSIGGPGKAHLVSEIDALGGEMGRNIDRSFTHIRVLNSSRGPAVRALRAQADKALYRASMKSALESQDGLYLIQDTAVDLIVDGARCAGVLGRSGIFYQADAVVVATGTFLNGVVHVGDTAISAGRDGEQASTHLADAISRIGVQLRRFKTGTVPRVQLSSIDTDAVSVQPSAYQGHAFSRTTVSRPPLTLLPCYQTYTTPDTHQLLRENSARSALWGGRIEGIGPRYCPSIEAKLIRFPDRDRHVVFLEQEGWGTDEIYVQGLSNSMPASVQLSMLRSVPGLRSAHMTRPGYAVEYDVIDPQCLRTSLCHREIEGLLFAGQINGTSGYEEAASQGLIAGINAARRALGDSEFSLARSDGYIGVLVDDITRSAIAEPYRMLTSRAESRLLFGQGTAHLRLEAAAQLSGLSSSAAVLFGQSELAGSFSFRRDTTTHGDESRWGRTAGHYVEREALRAAAVRTMEHVVIPAGIDLSVLPLRLEAQERLCMSRPATLGQLSRLPGITAADAATVYSAIRRAAK